MLTSTGFTNRVEPTQSDVSFKIVKIAPEGGVNVRKGANFNGRKFSSSTQAILHKVR
jgi:hypothetical protein